MNSSYKEVYHLLAIAIITCFHLIKVRSLCILYCSPPPNPLVYDTPHTHQILQMEPHRYTHTHTHTQRERETWSITLPEALLFFYLAVLSEATQGLSLSFLSLTFHLWGQWV